MIYLVDGTCYSHDTVLKLERELNAKRVSWESWFALAFNPFIRITQSNNIWLFTWDDSPFSGELFEKAMRLGIVPAQNYYYAAINTSQRLLGWSDLLERDISTKFKGWEDHAFLIPSDDYHKLMEVCGTLLRMEKERKDG